MISRLLDYVHKRKVKHMSITLSIPADIVRDARKYAESQGASLNAIIRDFLFDITAKAADRNTAAKSFRSIAASATRHLTGSAYTFSRSDAYDREV